MQQPEVKNIKILKKKIEKKTFRKFQKGKPACAIISNYLHRIYVVLGIASNLIMIDDYLKHTGTLKKKIKHTGGCLQ